MNLYAIIIVLALLSGGVAWLKHEVNTNADLRAKQGRLEGMLTEADNNTKFEATRAAQLEKSLSGLAKEKTDIAAAAADWKDRYEKALGKTPAARAWGDTDIDPAITEWMRERDADRAARVRRHLDSRFPPGGVRGEQAPKAGGDEKQGAPSGGGQRTDGQGNLQRATAPGA